MTRMTFYRPSLHCFEIASLSFPTDIRSYLTKIRNAWGVTDPNLSLSEALEFFMLCACKQNRKEVKTSVESVKAEESIIWKFAPEILSDMSYILLLNRI